MAIKTETIVCIVIIVVLLGVTIRLSTNQGKILENYEIVNWDNSQIWKKKTSMPFVNFPFGQKNWLGNYKIPDNSWFREQCNKYGPNPPYSGDVGCEDSMRDQRKYGSCTNFYCN